MEVWSFIGIVFALSAMILSADGAGILEIKLIKYTNDAGKDLQGQNCDLTSSCDHDLFFCLDNYRSATDQWYYDYLHCDYFFSRTGRLESTRNNYFADRVKIGSVPNPIVTEFKSWPGKITFKVQINDDDSTSRDDEVDYIVDKIELQRMIGVHEHNEINWSIIKAFTGTRRNAPTNLEVRTMLYCKPHYFGLACDIYCEASNEEVTGHYSCDEITGDKICLDGWEDVTTNCKIFADDCYRKPCLNGGTCKDLHRNYMCECKPNYIGYKCETKVDLCDPDPCLSGGVCTEEQDQVLCHCPQTHIGDRCQFNVCETKICQNGGTCVGNGECYCVPSYTGNHCETKICDTIQCENGGKCSVDICLCPSNYKGTRCEKELCDDVVCENGGTCSKGNCTCVDGYTGRLCDQIEDFCISNPCKNGATCFDNPTGYLCYCSSGHVGANCESDAPVTQPTTLEEKTTAPPDEENPSACISQPCQNGGRCYDNLAAYICSCPAGFTGANCQTKVVQTSRDPCANDPSPCKNEARCTTDGDDYTCTCLPEYQGQNCETEKTETVGPNPGALSITQDETEFKWWYYLVIGIGCLFLIAIIIIIVVSSKYRRKKSQLKAARRDTERQESFDNPVFQRENIYENTPGAAGVTPYAPTITSANVNNINLNIAPSEKHIYDVPSTRVRPEAEAAEPPAGAHGGSTSQDPPYAVPNKPKPKHKGLKTPPHLEERYRVMKLRKSSQTEPK